MIKSIIIQWVSAAFGTLGDEMVRKVLKPNHCSASDLDGGELFNGVGFWSVANTGETADKASYQEICTDPPADRFTVAHYRVILSKSIVDDRLREK
ncbi:hypothetical protein GW17_00037937 [Ensete ventricosum]|nr:hypothetical protein GW17_00037937 [Ensete ventricosum]